MQMIGRAPAGAPIANRFGFEYRFVKTSSAASSIDLKAKRQIRSTLAGFADLPDPADPAGRYERAAPSAAEVVRPRAAASPAASAAGSSVADRAVDWQDPPAVWPAHRASECVFDIFFVLLGRRSTLRCFVLILFRVQFKIEETGKVATGVASASSTASALTKGDLNLAEGGFSAQQSLQRFLLEWKRIFPLRRFQLVCRRSHICGGGLHVLVEFGELFVGLGDVAALHANRKCIDLVAELLLRVGEELALRCGIFRGCCLVVLLLPGRGDQFFLALGNFSLVVAAASAASSASACCDCENSRSKGSTWMKPMSVRASLWPSRAVA